MVHALEGSMSRKFHYFYAFHVLENSCTFSASSNHLEYSTPTINVLGTFESD